MTEPVKRIAFIDGSFVEEEKAMLHVTDLAIQRGYGVFDYLRIKDGKPLYFSDHIQRFFSSASEMRLNLSLSEHELARIIDELIKKNNASNAGVRLTLTGGRSADSYSVGKPTLAITVSSLQLPGEELFSKGISLMLFQHQRQLPHIKTIDYLMPIYLQPKIRTAGADEVLYHAQNKISECPRANVFVVKNNIVLTPADGILKGVTRKMILQMNVAGISIFEGTVTVGDILSADEVFISSTTKMILPVSAVDGKRYPAPGKITLQLYEELKRSQTDRITSSLPVYGIE